MANDRTIQTFNVPDASSYEDTNFLASQVWTHSSTPLFYRHHYLDNSNHTDIRKCLDDANSHILHDRQVTHYPLPISTDYHPDSLHYRATIMATNSGTNDLAEQERLAASYEPKFDGELVSQKKSIQLLEAKYENGDPMFQAHLQYLESHFPVYRSMRGDGSCGWRACFFGYYELLISIGNFNKFYTEKARLKEVSQLIPYEEDIWEDWFAEAAQLLEKLASAPDDKKREVLRTSFNDQETSMMLMSYLRALATGWMSSHSEDYAAWIEDGLTVSQYCDRNINPVQAELENLSLKVVFDVLLKPAGMAVDIYYLDRSVRDTVEPISFAPDLQAADTSTGKIPIVNLLYQIGHYDMLYPDSGVGVDIVQCMRFNEAYSISALGQMIGNATNPAVFGLEGYQGAIAQQSTAYEVQHHNRNLKGSTGPLSTNVGVQQPFQDYVEPADFPQPVMYANWMRQAKTSVPVGLPQHHVLKPGVMSQTAEERGCFRVSKEQLETAEIMAAGHSSTASIASSSRSRDISNVKSSRVRGFVKEDGRPKEKRRMKRS